MVLGLAVHILAAVIWVGGMFFAYVALRPSAGPLEPALRLPLWHRVFRRFFPWVWACVVALLASGYGMVFLGFGGFAGVGPHVHAMQATGIVMVLLFLHLFAAPSPPAISLARGGTSSRSEFSWRSISRSA